MTRPLSQILKQAREAFPGHIELKYIHPVLYLICSDPAFEGLDEEERLALFTRKTELPADLGGFPGVGAALSLVLATTNEIVRDYGFLLQTGAGQHWLPFFDDESLAKEKVDASAQPRGIHFYGYKGGQARTTVLAMLGQQLASDGYRVLIVDADVEAPSVDVLLDVAATSLAQTLMGLVNLESEIQPISAFSSSPDSGKIDVLACRPSAPEYDMDFAAFVVQTSLDVTALEQAFLRLNHWVNGGDSQERRYDVVLIDHRSGITTSVVPILKAYPGPVVICLRADEQSRGAMRVFKILFSQVNDTPGAFVSFSLDPEETREKMFIKHPRMIGDLLDVLGEALERGSSAAEDLPPDHLQQYWISWFHDRAFLGRPFPSMSELSEQNRDSLRQLREVFDLSQKRIAAQVSQGRHVKRDPKLSPSGATDEGMFIEPQEMTRLFQENTNITYIFGRKGTGKTRLLHELQERKLGEPLVVAADAKGGGLPTSDTLFTDLVSTFASDPEVLWWCILAAAIEVPSTSTAQFRDSLQKWEKKIGSSPSGLRVSEIARAASQLPVKRTFLIDGIETAFRSVHLIEFVESLFKFMLTIQTDSQFDGKVVVRLFLRTDLARRAIQNVEQQTARRRLDLTWNTQSIFNFVLSRISQIEWFRANFESACEKIDSRSECIRAGRLEAEEYEPLLLEIFPRHIRRNNLQTLTFLKTYFSDAASDDEAKAAFYPRLFDAFLNSIAHREELPHGAAPQASLEDGRVHQALVLASHEAASRRFLDEVKQELKVLLDLGKTKAENETRLNEFIAAFEGLRTPFVLDECVTSLGERVPELKSTNIRHALNRMKEVGMFEDRPGFSGWWRAGRLFKSALRMKYVR